MAQVAVELEDLENLQVQPGCYTASPLGAGATGVPVTVQAYPITVGGGGWSTGPSGSPQPKGTQSWNSIFSTITSAGGGFGGGSR